MTGRSSLLLFGFGLVCLPPLSAQMIAFKLDGDTRAAVTDSLARSLIGLYVFPDIGARMAEDIRARQAKGEFSGLNDPEAFAQALTDAMQGVSHDKHLRVRFSANPVEQQLDEHPSAEQQARREAFRRRTNYGFERVERLPGNVGYLDLRGFDGTEGGARETALAAMRFLSSSDALIIDLRKNGGGDPDMIALIAGTLYPRGKKVHLNDFYWREGNRTEERWTDPALDAPRITAPVYLLTSGYTFSAAEEFTYDLKQLKRAVQVGETTGGGANPGAGVPLSPNFGAFIPTGRAINPITRDNWEGKGCVPEIAVPAAEALKTAYLKALEGLLGKAKNVEDRQALEKAMAEAKATGRDG